MTAKSIQIQYDMAAIPRAAEGDFGAALDFRNAAMELIEDALMTARAGEWEGAEIGRGAINFGFIVNDFALAEAIARDAVKGTPYEKIRQIARREWERPEYA